MAGALGCAIDFSRVESGGCGSERSSVRQAASGHEGVAAEVLYIGYVPVSERRGVARGTSGRLYGDGYFGAVSPVGWLQRAASDGLGCVWFAGGAIRDPH